MCHESGEWRRRSPIAQFLERRQPLLVCTVLPSRFTYKSYREKLGAMCTELRAVLLGKTGTGKSSTGNTLLGRDAFRVGRGLRSGTECCQWADEEREDICLKVTDTPGLCDTHRGDQDVMKEVGKSVAVVLPGPHVVLMVLRCDTRFTKEEFGAYIALKTLFGEDIKDHMIVVFVGADAFGDTLEDQQRGVEQEMRKASGHIREVLRDANNRFFAINNKASHSDREKQANKLLDMMKELVGKNEGRFFRNNVSDEVGQIVEPLVARRMHQNNTSREQAERETNRAIVDETEDQSFFEHLSDLMKKKILPALEKAAGLLPELVEVATMLLPMAKRAKSMCSVM